MKYYIIAGEASGDLHGSNLMKSLYQVDPQANLRFWGGDLMQQVGGTLVKHFKDLAFMGFWEVIKNLKTILKNLNFCKKDIAEFQPDAIIFIDYPGFNMRIAKWAKQQKIPTHYYIAPQVWAWKENRVKDLKRDVDYLYVILPFEKPYFEEKHQLKVHFVGHPLLDAIEQFKRKSREEFLVESQLESKPIIALLPGSRKQEILKKLPIMLELEKSFPNHQLVIAGAPSLDADFYLPILKNSKAKILYNQTYHLLSHAAGAAVTSGTATLETALFEVPEVVCYKGNPISYWIAKRVITLPFISLVNLITEKEVVKELIQYDLNAENLQQEMRKILDPEHQKNLKETYRILQNKLDGVGASERTANIIFESLR
jgi:lipid-A-disaccharide synthase